MKFPLFLAACGMVALSACARNEFVGRPGLAIVENKELPAPTRADLMTGQQPYLIGPFDKLSIDVYGVEELTKKVVQVDAGGSMSFPLVGIVPAAGKTPEQVSSDIAARLRRYIRNPQVTVNAETVNRFVTIEGNVTEPGQYPVIGKMTLMRAIARAKGEDNFADEHFVVVHRQVAGKSMAALYDLRAIRQGMYPDPAIYADDVVSVGDSASKRTFALLVQGSGILVAPLVAILN